MIIIHDGIPTVWIGASNPMHSARSDFKIPIGEACAKPPKRVVDVEVILRDVCKHFNPDGEKVATTGRAHGWIDRQTP